MFRFLFAQRTSFLSFKKEFFLLRLGYHYRALDIGSLIGLKSLQALYVLLSLMHLVLSHQNKNMVVLS